MPGFCEQGFQIVPLAGATDIPDQPGILVLLKAGHETDASNVVVIDYSTRSVAGLVTHRANEPEVAKHQPELAAVKLLSADRSAAGPSSSLHDQTYKLREKYRPLISR